MNYNLFTSNNNKINNSHNNKNILGKALSSYATSDGNLVSRLAGYPENLISDTSVETMFHLEQTNCAPSSTAQESQSLEILL